MEGDIAVDYAEEAEGALEDPEGEGPADVVRSGELAELAVDPDSNDCEEGEELVDVKEGFVEGVADYGGGLYEDGGEGYRSEEAVGKEGA